MAMHLTMNTSATATLATSLPAPWTTTTSHEFAASLTHPMRHIIAITADDNHPIRVCRITDPSQCELAVSPGHHQGKWRAGVASWALSWQQGGHSHPSSLSSTSCTPSSVECYPKWCMAAFRPHAASLGWFHPVNKAADTTRGYFVLELKYYCSW